jgi:hypothetical protein
MDRGACEDGSEGSGGEGGGGEDGLEGEDGGGGRSTVEIGVSGKVKKDRGSTTA